MLPSADLPRTPALRAFLVVLVGVAAILLLNVFYIFPLFDRVLEADLEKSAIRIARHIQSASRGTVDGFALDAEDIGTLARNFDLTKVRGYAANGEVVYSTEDGERGMVNDHDYFHQVVAQGKVFHQIVDKNELTAEGTMAHRSVAEIYLPVMAEGRFMGAYEVYLDVTANRDNLTKAETLSGVSVCLSSVLILGMLWAGFVRVRAAQAAMLKANAQMQAVIDALPDPLFVIDRNRRVIMANGKARSVAEGDGPADFQTCHRVLHQSDRPCMGEESPCPFDQVMRTRRPVSVVHVRRCVGREPVWLEVLAAPIFDSGGRLERMVEVCHDISDRKLAEEALVRLRQENEELRGRLADCTGQLEHLAGLPGIQGAPVD